MLMVTLLALTLAAPTVQAQPAKIQIDENKEATVGFLLQPWFRLDMDPSKSEANGGSGEGTTSFDPYLRRARIMMSGKWTNKIYFFAETDSPNLGKAGDWTPTQYIQDAWVEYNVSPALQIDAGMLLVPFSYHAYQGATSLMLVDYHAGVIKYVASNNKVWRDAGIMFRGELTKDKKLEYRVSITNGVEYTPAALTVDGDGDGVMDTVDPRGSLNPGDMPRVVGRLAFNVFDPIAGPGVGGFFNKGVFLKKDGKKLISPKKVLTIGVSADYQGDAVYSGDSTAPALGLAADIFTDIPLGGQSAFTGQVDCYMYNHGEGAANTGNGGFFEVGYRKKEWQPVLSMEAFMPTEPEGVTGDAAKVNDTMTGMAGLNYWYKAHNSSIKGLVGMTKTVADADPATEDYWKPYALVQTQFLF